MKIFTYTGITALLMYCLSVANEASAQNLNAESTESATAILDTAIPFAIGAREGEQTIRGALGWPTFQEGFVEGVYFRFDPDGYARFSTSPRLDEDVFEVICQNGTTQCLAKKNSLEISLTAQGQPQIQISGTTPIDRFFISDHKNELPLPNTIIGPIDQRLEALLSSGGDLILRRELETLQTLSLSGFLATVTYLRWVAQNQSSFVFPRGWPAPSQQVGQQNAGLAQSDAWNSTHPTPAATPTLWATQNAQGINGRPLNSQPLQNRVTQINPRPSITGRAGTEELSALGFVQQAQGRNLPADLNRFSVAPLQDGYTQTNTQAAFNNSKNLQAFQTEITAELIRINQSLINLDVKIDNLAIRLTHEFRSANINTNMTKNLNSSTYQNINQNASNTQINPGTTEAPLSEEDRLRQLVIESLLQQSRQEKVLNPSPSNMPSAGEITIKKTIVERLLEELNEPSATPDETATPVVENTGEFISLSDYINKVMRDEKRQ